MTAEWDGPRSGQVTESDLLPAGQVALVGVTERAARRPAANLLPNLRRQSRCRRHAVGPLDRVLESLAEVRRSTDPGTDRRDRRPAASWTVA